MAFSCPFCTATMSGVNPMRVLWLTGSGSPGSGLRVPTPSFWSISSICGRAGKKDWRRRRRRSRGWVSYLGLEKLWACEGEERLSFFPGPFRARF
jgi:hypothetical protein